MSAASLTRILRLNHEVVLCRQHFNQKSSYLFPVLVGIPAGKVDCIRILQELWSFKSIYTKSKRLLPKSEGIYSVFPRMVSSETILV